MALQLNNTIANIEQTLASHGKVVSSLSQSIGITMVMARTLKTIIISWPALLANTDTYGTGVWYDYNRYRPEQKYFGLYAYRDEASILFEEVLYSTDEYDYPQQEWYTFGQNTNGDLAWSAP